MRPHPPRIIIPAPVALWLALGMGHLASACYPLPAHLESGARASAIAAGAISLWLAAAARRPTGSARRGAAVAEAAAGYLALVLAGAALGGEADRAAWPLPVHPAEVQVTLEGRVLDTAAIDAEPAELLFEARRIEIGEAESACRVRLVLRWRDGTVPPRWILPGLWLRFSGRYRPPEDARNSGTSAPGRWLERLGVAGAVAADPLSISAPSEPPERGASLAAMLRDRLARAFAEDLSRPVAALARGMLLGDRSGIDPAVRRSFRDGGTIHILSISGLHVCILAGFLSLAAAALRLPRGAALGLELGVLWVYVALVGAPASAIRSALLWTSVRSGRVLGQVVRPFTAWGLAGLILHLLDPSSVLDPGFQLSFVAVLGLGASGSLSRLPVPKARARRLSARVRAVGAATWSLFAQSAGATAGTIGIQSRLFGAVPVVGLFLNLAVIPLCTLFMAEAMLYLALKGLGLPGLVGAAAGALEATGLLLLGLNAWGAGLLPPWIVPHLPAPPAVVLGAVALLAAWGRAEAARGGDPSRASASRWSLAALALAVLVPLAPAWSTTPPMGHPAVVLAIDVGQGDATWVGLPDGSSMLVDAGPSDGDRDAGERAVEPALRAEGRGRLRTAVLSHAHLDHYGGFTWLASRGWIGQFVENGSDAAAAWRSELARALRRGRGSPLVVARDTVVSWPAIGDLDLLRGLDEGAENDRSIAARLRVRGVTALFAGDLEEAGESALLPRLGPVHILKAPHHGSRTSSGPAWVEGLVPRIVLVSCGERNRFGHPDGEVLHRYRRHGAHVLRTDQEGSVRVTLHADGAWISTRRHPAPFFVSWDRTGVVTPSSHIP